MGEGGSSNSGSAHGAQGLWLPPYICSPPLFVDCCFQMSLLSLLPMASPPPPQRSHCQMLGSVLKESREGEDDIAVSSTPLLLLPSTTQQQQSHQKIKQIKSFANCRGLMWAWQLHVTQIILVSERPLYLPRLPLGIIKRFELAR